MAQCRTPPRGSRVIPRLGQSSRQRLAIFLPALQAAIPQSFSVVCSSVLDADLQLQIRQTLDTFDTRVVNLVHVASHSLLFDRLQLELPHSSAIPQSTRRPPYLEPTRYFSTLPTVGFANQAEFQVCIQWARHFRGFDLGSIFVSLSYLYPQDSPRLP